MVNKPRKKNGELHDILLEQAKMIERLQKIVAEHQKTTLFMAEQGKLNAELFGMLLQVMTKMHTKTASEKPEGPKNQHTPNYVG